MKKVIKDRKVVTVETVEKAYETVETVEEVQCHKYGVRRPIKHKKGRLEKLRS